MAPRRSEDKPRKRPPARAVPPAAPAAPAARRTRARPAPSAAPAAPACVPPAPQAAQAQSFWRAGLRALDNVRHDVQRRQASVIETLLGIPPTAAAATEARLGLPGLPGLDAFGLRKFEDVFDQRVAAALERLGMPTREEVQALHDKLDRVLAQLERLGAAAEAPATATAKPARPARPAKAAGGRPRARQPR
ncbi:phasin family protein [Xenophilus sp. Marseille-Q4582]|uniref:phasin family protein n=1 Tax=Xenophilus sp. Marseille-Q4582 TaxID=2866600 RepID=UPI001CE43A14|nr:phasin family protein [Xenophilus sp. Marseille-Q4582]